MTTHSSLVIPKVSIHKGKAITTSQDVAEYFNKRHDNVLRAIGSLECSSEFRLLNFEETFYIRENPNGGDGISTKCYEMTKDGFVFLVMGFTGKKAAQFKEAYIAEFNRMEAQLHNAVTVTGNTNKILLTLLPNGKVDSARVIHDNEYVASLESLFEIGRRAGYMIIHKDELIKKLSE
ncbi:Rha family transcriptional regulator [Arsenophonus apicola]|jgi:Rha family phage regulatory protein|uniref:Rha family transcriptional regulator n=2 Tax=Arsenophonus apicola TaxID=2879119 RepID=UPI002872BCB8|nr:Rha family transcriptional regulator [Arsenophonus apicola]